MNGYPSFCFTPVDFGSGVSASQTEKSQPLRIVSIDGASAMMTTAMARNWEAKAPGNSQTGDPCSF